MSDIAIRCEGLSKQYRIGKRERYRALRDVLTDSLSAPFRALGSAFRNGSSLAPSPGRPLAPSSSFWALDDVSFEVKHGEVVGIIGRNGAGKSTLLKILSRITEPTRGFAEINGRVGSLLEVGTGFHPELTGRENIYLNGAILGMKRAEIERKFDEIVDFAETEKFLDTAVKYYSSGMHVRLAFAVAAHMEIEVLLVDEVLAVGDADFQKKCLGKMRDVACDGRTVLFVSHQMNVMESLCARAIVLDEGTVRYLGSTRECIQFYLGSPSRLNGSDLSLRRDRRGSGSARCSNLRILGDNSSSIESGGALSLVLTVQSSGEFAKIVPGINVNHHSGARVATFWCGFTEQMIEMKKGENKLLLEIDCLNLAPGNYTIGVNLGFGIEPLDDVENVIDLIITAPKKWRPAKLPNPTEHGFYFTSFRWSLI